ncbi:hypothetical protein [Mycobacteroides abscessus]|uniref:hypothetical protein n=1 Tax=Mycobacteroides abscessus TaxID=36809 RepID=UPI00092697DC|nr:hypothetical protein [Mycobacteroides abscessus]SHR28281.1 Uncharacterised protein [Mycobacteroides abscessus subsp. bolletii]SHT28410.1 Uncharacterised protein [Mycobacteroides abscessus subsp. bolletii]SHT47072.1 Uncharacterised protein [Mycobacteroides abscessus subsp. bolletii]SKG59454.1 Uncharacterised protein [Mycobacteroides abscessus subsp. bolletii]SKH15806.1 Uncharacterised protein [Mycobacteroides abscessus subsp. bolletii]
MQLTTKLASATERGFLPPPVDLQVGPAWAWFVVIVTGILLVVTVVLGIYVTRKTRSPMFILTLVGALAFPMFVEPLGDIIGATWYPSNHLYIVGDFFGRPMPLFVFLFYLAGIPLITCSMYAVMRAGASAKLLIGMWALLAIPEITGEIIAAHVNVMNYYGNNVILGVPASSIVQNGGFMVVIGWLMIALHPEDKPAALWRWALTPFVAPFGLMIYAIAATGGSYMLIHTQTYGPPLWATTAGSVLLNIALPLLLIYNPILTRIRQRRTATTEELKTAMLFMIPPAVDAHEHRDRTPSATL